MLSVKIMWCWRCQMKVPMLDEAEFAVARKLYWKRFYSKGATRQQICAPLLDYYRDLTGFDETEPNAIMHHEIAHYGKPCSQCGKPLRTSQASFCAECGNRIEM